MSELALLVASNWFAANLPLFSLALYSLVHCSPSARVRMLSGNRYRTKDRGGNFERSISVRLSAGDLSIRFRWLKLAAFGSLGLSSGFN